MKAFLKLDFILSLLNENSLVRVVTQTICAMFEDNRYLISQVPKHALRRIVNELYNVKNPDFLRVLITLVQSNAKPLRRNQSLISSLFAAKGEEVIVMHNDHHTLRKRKELIDSDDYLDEDGELSYHALQLDLFYLCCKGKVGEPEIILQALFPEQLVLNQITDVSNLLLLRAKYLSFFVELYMETEKISKEYSSAPQVWELLSLVKNELMSYYQLMQKRDAENPKGIDKIYIIPTPEDASLSTTTASTTASSTTGGLSPRDAATANNANAGLRNSGSGSLSNSGTSQSSATTRLSLSDRLMQEFGTNTTTQPTTPLLLWC